jgi:hypothetical protein
MNAEIAFRRWVVLALLLLSGCAGQGKPDDAVRVAETTLFGDLECFRVETPGATYLYGKRGAGFVSILDPLGYDWISYRHGGKALGEYRGLPKCGQPVKYFHAGYGFGQYRTENPFTSRVVVEEPHHVRITSETKDGASAADWDFFPSCAVLTLRRIAQPRYWFLYEGTPGGELDPESDMAIRPGGRRTTLTEPWQDEIPWVCFASRKSPYGLLLVSHEERVRAASYVAWPYKPEKDGGYRQMTVFGWGRPGWTDPRQHEPQLAILPASFGIAFVRATDEPELLRAVEEASRPNGRNGAALSGTRKG